MDNNSDKLRAVKSKKVLVTGGAGYIGSTLVPMLLADGYKVCVLDNLMYDEKSLETVWANPNFTFIKGDVKDIRSVCEALKGVDSVIHLAAIVGDPACASQPELAQSVNQDASLMLLKECKSSGVSRFIFASTCSNYGRMKDTAKLADESSELRPLSLYAESKVNVEQAILNQDLPEGLSVTILRFATIYGISPRMRFDLTVNEFTMKMLTEKRLVVYGEQFWRPYVHVKDVANALRLVLEAPCEKVRNNVFNVGSTDQNYRKEDLVRFIKEYVPNSVIEKVHKEEDPRDYKVSFRKIEEDLGFNTAIGLQESIAEIIDFVNKAGIRDFADFKYRNTLN